MTDTSKILDAFGGVVITGTSGNDTLVGTSKAETFYISGTESGDDVIQGFGKNDILVLDFKIYDSNNDGKIGFGSNKLLDLDGSVGDDTVKFDASVKGLRYLGTDGEHFVYGDVSVRLSGFKEGTLANNTFTGTSGVDKFFFDTDLDVNWGSDTINRFGAEDFLVTTSALYDSNNDGRVNFGANHLLDLQGSDELGHGDDPVFGQVAITNTAGNVVTDLYLDHVTTVNGVTYYYYGLNAPITETVVA